MCTPRLNNIKLNGLYSKKYTKHYFRNINKLVLVNRADNDDSSKFIMKS